MPRVFDNIEQHLLGALADTLQATDRADFCVGYFNLRGWKKLDRYIEAWPGGEGHCCRLLVGMQDKPEEDLRAALSSRNGGERMNNAQALRLKQRLANEFRAQLAFGVPSNEDEAGLRRLAAQIRAGKVVVKLFLKHHLHAKLYLCFRPRDPINPAVGFVGSSNLTLAGLLQQGELNLDVVDQDACNKLARWFEERWNDHWCIDISQELVRAIEESWAREALVPPYHIYLKMAYHLSQEARAGLSQFQVPREFRGQLFDFQTAAVRIAAQHLHKRRGVLIGDVVGLGKTLMATALARIFEDDFGLETLILCPANLTRMWEDYRERYRLRARVLSMSQAIRTLPHLRRYRLLIIDESHNLRNREGKRYRAIREYIQENECRCILLTATPYNKTYTDLSNQLRLFVPEDEPLPVRPERLLRELGEIEFQARHQCSPRSLDAFDKSEFADDWRDLMRLYMVRRTRSFIQANYAACDEAGRKYLTFADGRRSYFPVRRPRTLKFTIDEQDPSDQYARLYSPAVVDAINSLCLPRYGLGNYVRKRPAQPPTAAEKALLDNLSRAGKRLMGFCRTNLFKRLESSGQVFLQSLQRHVLRNYVYLHCLESGQDLPIGTQDAALLDPSNNDEDADALSLTLDFDQGEEDDRAGPAPEDENGALHSEADYQQRAAQVYQAYRTVGAHWFKWIRPDLFAARLAQDLRADSEVLLGILQRCGDWDPAHDAKLQALLELLTEKHPQDKVLIFSQYADTVRYLVQQLEARGVGQIAGATGGSQDPTELAYRFSPVSNDKRAQVSAEQELRVLAATDVLSEGQNLQDCAVVVNYDLPWAIIRLIQRAGRVDRIGQQAGEIACYTFLPAEGVERIIRLRSRVQQRLRENAEVVGTDEAFFGEGEDVQKVLDLYNEKAGVLDGEDDREVDLASYAYQIWKNATDADPSLARKVEALPPVVWSARRHEPAPEAPAGVLCYLHTAQGNDALVWVDGEGRIRSQSEFAVLRAAECAADTPALPRSEQHYNLVQKAVNHVGQQEQSAGGQLGRPSGARFRTYTRLKAYVEANQGTLWVTTELLHAIDELYRYPLRESATDTLNRQLRSGIDDATLAEVVTSLHEEGRLCLVQEEQVSREPAIICSLGLYAGPA